MTAMTTEHGCACFRSWDFTSVSRREFVRRQLSSLLAAPEASAVDAGISAGLYAFDHRLRRLVSEPEVLKISGKINGVQGFRALVHGIEKSLTGIDGFDELTLGGLPTGRNCC